MINTDSDNSPSLQTSQLRSSTSADGSITVSTVNSFGLDLQRYGNTKVSMPIAVAVPSKSSSLNDNPPADKVAWKSMTRSSTVPGR